MGFNRNLKIVVSTIGFTGIIFFLSQPAVFSNLACVNHAGLGFARASGVQADGNSYFGDRSSENLNSSSLGGDTFRVNK